MSGASKLDRIAPPEFVTSIIQRLWEKGHEVYIVGGAVRDALLGRRHQDWDLATTASAAQIRRIFPDIRHYQLKSETVSLVGPDYKVEVTPFRGGDPMALQEDLAHRDFTINALAYCPRREQLIDPFGGLADLRRRKIRAVGSPMDRFREDPIRLLRAVRLCVELGMDIEVSTQKSMETAARLIESCAAERIRDELTKILVVPTPSVAFHLLRRTGLISYILPELLEGYLKRQNKYHRYTIFRHIMVTLDTVKPTLLLRLVALLHDIGKPRTRTRHRGHWRFLGHEEESAKLAEQIMERLRFSSGLTRKVAHLVRHHLIEYNPQWSDSAVRRWIRKVGIENAEILIIFRRADLLAHATPLADRDLRLLQEFEKRVKEILSAKNSVFAPSGLAVDGEDVMRLLGIPPGPEVGKVLKGLLELVTENPELNTRKQLVDILLKGYEPGKSNG
ncbi:MAG: polynucleotide adenylyltransferase [Deltaproteobacteria bacterium]|nr:MAG: polynucleotide adenylyltransferase [Deltaproteobacteria bacterium]